LSRDVLKKLEEGEELDEDDIQYAHDRGIDIGDDYATPIIHDSPNPPTPIMQTGPAFPPGPSNLDALTPEQRDELRDALDAYDEGPAEGLDGMTKAELLQYAEEHGIEANSGMNKDEIKAAINETEGAG